MVKTTITDAGGSGRGVKVSSIGQLATSPFAYDDTKFIELAEDDTAYSFYPPLPKKQFVITIIRGKADRDVSNTVDAIVVIYEAEDETDTTVFKVIHQEALIRGESFTISTNIIVTAGKFVNAKTTDDDIHMTIMGYYVPQI